MYISPCVYCASIFLEIIPTASAGRQESGERVAVGGPFDGWAMGWRAKTPLFKHDRPEAAGYFVTSAMRQCADRLAQRGVDPWGGRGGKGWHSRGL